MNITDNDISSLYPHTMDIKKTKPFHKVDEGVVDGELWHTVSTTSGSEVDKWLRKNGAIQITTVWPTTQYFDLSDKLYMLLLLRFQ